MARKKKSKPKGKKPLVWEPLDDFAALFALVLILGGFFLAVKGSTEVDNVLIQIAGGLFILTGFIITRLLRLVAKEYCKEKK
jgi:hypothetical protein